VHLSAEKIVLLLAPLFFLAHSETRLSIKWNHCLVIQWNLYLNIQWNHCLSVQWDHYLSIQCVLEASPPSNAPESSASSK
jgi:hypothetical protein